jgi:hypothetical protein
MGMFVGTAGLTSLLDWINNEPFGGTFGGAPASHEKVPLTKCAGVRLVTRAGVTQW